MKMIFCFVLVVVVIFVLVGVVQVVDIVGVVSVVIDVQLYVKVGVFEVNGGLYSVGKVGIGVGIVFNVKLVDFQGLVVYLVFIIVGNVIVCMLVMLIIGIFGNYVGMGYFNFVKVGSGDVWFGEWFKDGVVGGFNNCQVYFVGDCVGIILFSGIVMYVVVGLNKFNGSNLFSGIFVVNFGIGKLIGGLIGGGQILVISVNINSVDVFFVGIVVVNGLVIGNSQGQFFGVNVVILVGIVMFVGNSQYDIVFGGSKN